MKLRLLRIIVSVIAFGVLTGSLASIGGMMWGRFAAWLAGVQFMQAALTFALSTVLVWLIVTLIFGRVYCSSLCPLGTLQDIVARLPRLGSAAARRPYSYSPPLTRWRVSMLLVTVAAIMLSIASVVSLLDPYGLYASVAGWVFTPVKIAAASAVGLFAGIVVMSTVLVLAFRGGRTYCNSICPVGTTLGFVSKYSLFHIDINTDLCTGCRRCEEVCKASCINLYDHIVDGSRCVCCFDCTAVCPDDAISYTFRRHQLADPLMRRVRNTAAGQASLSAPRSQGARAVETRLNSKSPSVKSETVSRTSE
ncbi:MAG: 4Fe-4S binding protein [Duncaniella sp.]|nr:4Fe-4S binding protein [Duncaniella sp.]